jgi:hypothetical protein
MAQFEMPSEMLLKDAIGDGGRLLIDYHIGVAREEFRAAVSEGLFTDAPVLFVDGRQKKGISGLKFGGKLEFVDENAAPINEAVQMAQSLIEQRAPILTGAYLFSFVVEVNGTEYAMGAQPEIASGDTVRIYPKGIPYAAKLELQRIAQDGPVYHAWKKVRSKYQAVLGVRYGYPTDLAAVYDTRAGQNQRPVPVLTIGPRSKIFTTASKPGARAQRKGRRRRR